MSSAGSAPPPPGLMYVSRVPSVLMPPHVVDSLGRARPTRAALRAARRMCESHDALFGLVGSAAGKEVSRWCRGPRLNHALRSLRGSEPNRASKRLVIDVGSLDGLDAIGFARFAQLPVWTFEAGPTKIEPIRERLRAAGFADNITLFAAALGNRSGEAWFEMTLAPHTTGRRFMRGQLGSATDKLVTKPTASATPKRDVSVVSVPMQRLDDLVVDHETRVPFLKVDAQGFDFEVLRGAERLLRGGFVDRFLFEFMPSGMPDTGEAARGLKFIQELGHYACTPCNGASAPITMSRPTCAASYVQDYATASSHRRAAGGDWYDDIACVHRRLLTPQGGGGGGGSSADLRHESQA